MKLLMNRKLATRIGIITTAITVTGMLMLWFTVSSRVASMVEKDITNQAEEYITAFALGNEVRSLLMHPENPALLERGQKYTEDFAAVKGIFEGLYIGTPDTYIPHRELSG